MTVIYSQAFQNANSFADFSANQICAASPIKGAMNNNSKTFTSFNHVKLL